MHIFTGIKKDLSAWLLLVPTLFCFIFFTWQPIMKTAYLSFFEMKGFTMVKFVGLNNYWDAIQNSGFRQTMLNTFSYVLWSLVIGFCIPIIVAVLVNELRRGSSFFKFAFYFPAMLPGVAVALLWNILYDPSPGGALNMLLSYIGVKPFTWLTNAHFTIPLIIVSMTWRGFGSTAILYLASLQGVNLDLYEAAALDGAGIRQRIRHVTIPQILPIIQLLLILQIAGVFQVFTEPFTMTDGGPNNASMTLGLQSYFNAFRYNQIGQSLAISMITFVCLMAITALYFRMTKDQSEA